MTSRADLAGLAAYFNARGWSLYAAGRADRAAEAWHAEHLIKETVMTRAQLVDYSFARPDPAVIAKDYAGVIRYLSHDPKKDLTPAERDALFAEGLDILLVWETTGVTTGGSDVGKAQAAEANKRADALGYPKTSPIFFVSDHDYSPDQVSEYYKGVAAGAAAAGRPWGLYGGIKLIDGISAPYYWQAAGWSDNKVSKRAHLHQLVGGATITGTDVNDVLIAVPMWRSGTTQPHPAPSPSTEEYNMRRIDLSDVTPPVLDPDMKKLQGLLLAHGYGPAGLVGSDGRPDGKGGPATQQFLGLFQVATNTGDGRGHADDIAGPNTWRALLES